MILAVNIGNTNIRAAVTTDGGFKESLLYADEIGSAGSFKLFIESEFGRNIWNKIDGSILCSVVPEMTPIVTKVIKEQTDLPPQRVDTACAGLDISGYGGNLGEDRIVCCAAALKRYGAPFILIDFGTATTVNVVNAKGVFEGGAILTGVMMGLTALSEDTSQLSMTDISGSARVIGRSTDENLASGAVIASAFAVEGYVRHVQKETNAAVIVTGGHAPLVLPYCGFEYYHEPNLLIKGLFTLYKRRLEYKVMKH